MCPVSPYVQVKESVDDCMFTVEEGTDSEVSVGSGTPTGRRPGSCQDSLKVKGTFDSAKEGGNRESSWWGAGAGTRTLTDG